MVEAWGQLYLSYLYQSYFDFNIWNIHINIFTGGEGINAGSGEGEEWIVEMDSERFNKLNPVDGKITGSKAKEEMVKSKLPNNVLGKIWKLSDISQNGMLDEEEFSLAMHLVKIKKEGHDLPATLPAHLIPPSKRGFSQFQNHW